MKKQWAFIDTGFRGAAWNMAFDECLINWHQEGKIPPTLRFYGWEKPSLSIGYFQKVDKKIDLEAVERHQCQFVRRLTGGSAVLHDDELTYSLVITESDPDIPVSVQEAYHVLAEGIFEGYRNLGIPAEYATLDRESARGRTAICFEKPAFYEMVVDGKKLSGNAQTRKKGVLMQHGSIPMSMNTNMLFDLFVFSSEKIRERSRAAFSKKAVTINQLTNREHRYDMLTDAFKEGFKEGLGLEFHPLQLTKAEWDEVEQLAQSKYETEAWNINSNKERAGIG
ncbi:octanoyltransferase LipM [Oceanobacillus oncorhynchi subsp. incaldanensis]|uniref:Octanoyltransferase LipM n=2 Tax=Oceanobacillus TaxID=182709 RepID=A0A0A1MMU8_9BACI|nr:lipoate--protein ligase family protein [Oceanobacillus oncorhynchi]MDM8099184.1 lipoate--protein ligase family protein [Oceanobacillus oncorhynchi]UUI38679.1 lipoate--protein ligase family protein [Oceanobacillus oncorhynchi]GIO18305.1 octanoyltransferase LipM [Oceanobacillus oncorhynchi subsp. incaldanensis]CEI84373.1 Octanoyltransferase LipM [Oceanobacillus oncorhynchi]